MFTDRRCEVITDHPRIRGEHVVETTPDTGTRGSSPHTRGARPARCAGWSGPRIIPAYAGSTYKVEGGKKLRPDHPRIRGEHGTRCCEARGLKRIIPAYAGSTISSGCSATMPRDHPRIRGEHRWDGAPDNPEAGSSPHTRGAPHPRHRRVLPGRIIPAYAGSTSGLPLAEWRRADHPRIRGEHWSYLGWLLGGMGSSPHTRGARFVRRDDILRLRIIPAYAGSTVIHLLSGNRRKDHPRIRGEHALSSILADDVRGSSPHTRGAHAEFTGIGGPSFIIPAYAGSTPPDRGRRGRRQDHPRIRGEHSPRKGAHAVAGGSSPHTRGAREDHGGRRPMRRIIPAYAGSTPMVSVSIRRSADHPRIRGEHDDEGAEGVHEVGSSPHTRGART